MDLFKKEVFREWALKFKISFSKKGFDSEFVPTFKNLKSPVISPEKTLATCYQTKYGLFFNTIMFILFRKFVW